MIKETTEEKGTVVYMDKGDVCYGGVIDYDMESSNYDYNILKVLHRASIERAIENNGVLHYLKQNNKE